MSKADRFQDIEELKQTIRSVEGIIVGLSGEPGKLYRPYPQLRPSPGNMMGREWVAQFERLYPEIDLTFPAEHLRLADLRRRTMP